MIEMIANPTFFKVTERIRANEFTTDELLAIFNSVYGTSSYNANDKHNVYFGNRAVRFTFKSGTRKIREVEVRDTSSEEFKRVEKYVADDLAENQEGVVISHVVFQRCCFDLSFQWGEEFQIFPAPSDAPAPGELVGHFSGVIQCRYKSSEAVWLDAVRQKTVRRRVFFRLVPIVAQSTGRPLFDPFWQPNFNKSWVITFDGSQHTSQWVQLGYTLPNFDYSQYREDMNTTRCPNLKVAPDSASHQDNLIREYLMAFEDCSEEEQSTFLAAAEWYHNALTARTQTEAYLALSIMIETLLPDEAGQCSECGQPTYAISKKFQDFIVTHAGNAADENLQKLAKTLYGLRSGIAHKGRWLADEYAGFTVGFVPQGVEERNLLKALYDVGSTVLCSWLINAAKTSKPAIALN